MASIIEGVVLRIERTSIHDGEGLRTVMFLKGCPLSCQWCSTPESQKTVLEKGYIADRCIGCGECVTHCPSGALSLINETVGRDEGLCNNCFTCVSVCPGQAHKSYGKTMSVAEALDEISKDEIFFYHSGGGVTLSGGECLFQPDFAAGVLEGSRQRGINTAIETSLFAPWQNVEKVLPFINTLYVDIKHPNSREHKNLVGVENDLILTNLNKLDTSYLSFDLHLRIPLIPGLNDADETLLEFLTIAARLKKIREIEILPYHRLGVITYEHLGRSYRLEDLQTPSSEYIIERADYLKRQGPTVPVKIGGGYL